MWRRIAPRLAIERKEPLVRRALLFGAIVALLLVADHGLAAAPPGTPIARDPSGYCVSADDRALLALINELRATHDAPPLQVSQAFGAAAQYHVTSMRDHRYFAHDVIPDGLSWWTLAQQFGATSQWHGENIAWGNADAAATFAQWMSDQIHYDNLVDPHYTVIGIGRVTSAPPDPAFTGTTTIWAVTFGDHLDQAARACSDPNATPVVTAVPLSDAPTPQPTTRAPINGAPTL